MSEVGTRPGSRVMTVRRRATILAAIYAPPAAACAFAGRVLVPPILVGAYHGRSFPLLNRVLHARQVPHPVEHYLDLWRAAWQALLLAWLFHLVAVVVVMACGRAARGVDRWLIGLALAFLLFTVLSGPRQDYVAYLEMWDAVRAGTDPWWVHERWGYPLNAYGPLFNLLAPVAGWNPMAPKLLFALAYCLFAVIYVKRGLASGPIPVGCVKHTDPGAEAARWCVSHTLQDNCETEGIPVLGLLAWLFGPFAWVEVAYFGHFDVLVAIACVAAAAGLERGREVLSGTCLALGFLLKLIPVVIVPFLVFDLGGRRVRVRLLVAALLPMALGYGASFLIWGTSTFRPFTFATTRGSTLLSIFNYLREGASPLRWFVDEPNLDPWSTRCLAVAGLTTFLVCQWRRTGPATSVLVASLTTLLFYQVGFLQYQMIPFLVMAYWLGRHGRSLRDHRVLAVAIAAYFGWLSLFDLFYAYAGGSLHADGPWRWVSDRVGLPTFLLGSFLLVGLLRWRDDHGSSSVCETRPS